MKKLWIIILLTCVLNVQSQMMVEYEISLIEKTVENHPGLQSFVSAEYGGEWLLLGGRTDGLHRIQPWAAFLESDNNNVVYVLNPKTGELWFAPLATSNPALYEQLQSTNMQFEMKDTVLYVTGGYGFSATNNNHITFPNLTAINVPSFIASVKKGALNMDAVRYVEDERVRVTGGYLDCLNDVFYLIGGNKFMGRYNPQGPDFGPGFSQEYTNQIRKFAIEDDGENLSIINYEAITDSALFHRRDYNLVPQRFQEGETGFTIFSGVFQYEEDIPWLNTVDVFEDRYEEKVEFEQRLNQYHGACMPFYDERMQSMNTVFFGGIGRFWYENGILQEDVNVPFVKTISMISRDVSGDMMERKMGDMPAYLGASAEFFPNPDREHDNQQILSIGSFSEEKLLMGHIYGGIESTAPNIFFINDGTQSHASNRLFEVWLKCTFVGSVQESMDESRKMKVFPNPLDQGIHLTITNLNPGSYDIQIVDLNGRIVFSKNKNRVLDNAVEISCNFISKPSGYYEILLEDKQGNKLREKLIVR